MLTPNIIPVPAGLPHGEWSAVAIRVLEERYLWKDETGKVVETPDEAMWRVARAIALAEEQEERAYQRAGSRVDWGDRVVDRRIYAWAEKFYRELVSRRFMPNSPTIASTLIGPLLLLLRQGDGPGNPPHGLVGGLRNLAGLVLPKVAFFEDADGGR